MPEPTPEPKPLDAERLAEIRKRVERIWQVKAVAVWDEKALLGHIDAQAAELALAKQAVLDEGFKGAAAEERVEELAAENDDLRARMKLSGYIALAEENTRLAAELAALRRREAAIEQAKSHLHDYAFLLGSYDDSAKWRKADEIRCLCAALAPTQAQGDETRG